MGNLKYFSLLIAAGMFAACSDNLENGGNVNEGPKTGEGYVKVAINTPSVSSSRAFDDSADGTLNDGTPDEYAVNNAILVFFKTTSTTGPGTPEVTAEFAKAYNVSLNPAGEGDDNHVTNRHTVIGEAPLPADGEKVYALAIVNSNDLFSVNANTGELNIKTGTDKSVFGTTKTLSALQEAIETTAAECAQDVIEHSGLMLASTNNGDPAFTTETLFGINIYQMDENYTDVFSRGPEFGDHYYLRTNKLDNIFDRKGEGVNDIRCRDYAFYIYNDQQVAITRKYQTAVNNLYMVPLIRLPEMYYILCESMPLDQAAPYISEVMEYRGLNGYQQFSSEQEREDALDKEYRKEFYAEGQYFYFLKAHGRTDFATRPEGLNQMTEAQYVFPLPDAEKEYGWTSENEDNEDNNDQTVEAN